MYATPLYRGRWFDAFVSAAKYVLCEGEPFATTSPAMPATSELSEQLTPSSEFVELDNALEQRFYNLSQAVFEFKNANSMKFDKLQVQTNDLALEVEYQKRQANQLIYNLKADADKSKKLIEHLESQVNLNKKQNVIFVHQIELLQMRLNRMEKKMSTNIAAI